MTHSSAQERAGGCARRRGRQTRQQETARRRRERRRGPKVRLAARHRAIWSREPAAAPSHPRGPAAPDFPEPRFRMQIRTANEAVRLQPAGAGGPGSERPPPRRGPLRSPGGPRRTVELPGRCASRRHCGAAARRTRYSPAPRRLSVPAQPFRAVRNCPDSGNRHRTRGGPAGHPPWIRLRHEPPNGGSFATERC